MKLPEGASMHSIGAFSFFRKKTWMICLISKQCGQKAASPFTAREEFEKKFKDSPTVPGWVKHGIESALIKLGL